MTDTSRDCPHCRSCLKKWLVPDGATWDEEYFYVCFNDECPYYQRGWTWMKERYNQQASYRYVMSPATGASWGLPVWSSSAIRNMIVEDDEGDGA